MTGIPARAADLNEALDRLAAAAESEESLSPEFKSALENVIQAMRESPPANPGTVAGAPADAPKTLWDRIHPFGDIRLRVEGNRNRPGLDDRNRARVRFRLGAEIDLHEDVVAGFRVTTGELDDPNSSHQTLDEVFNRYDFNLDSAYMRYAPSWLEGAYAIGGKFEHLFVRNPIYGELRWDRDVHPEGFAIGYERTVLEDHDLAFTLGEYFVIEQDDGGESLLFMAQVAADSRWSESWRTRLALGLESYSRLSPDDSDLLVAGNRGNLTVDVNRDGIPDEYASDFTLLNPIASITYDGGRWPLTVAAEYIKNTRAETSDDQGYAVGLSLGQVESARDWKTFYQWQRIERESVFSPFAQDDFLLATNFKGHVLGVDVGIANNMSVRVWALLAKQLRDGADDSQLRLRVDLNASF